MFRLLEVGEVTESEDEYYHGGYEKWVLMYCGIIIQKNDRPVRRVIKEKTNV